MSRRAGLARTAAAAAGVAGLGLLHATAAGAIVVAGLSLAAPDVMDFDGAPEAAVQAVSFGLASLRVPLESGDLRGTFAPLTALALTVWGLVSATRKLPPRSRGERAAQVVGVATAFGVVCAGAAVATTAADAAASTVGAAVAGAAWGAAAATWATSPRTRRPGVRGLLSRGGAGGSVAPGVVAAAVALALAAAWFVVAVLVWVGGLPAGAAVGGLVLALTVAPNAAVALVAIALGGRVEVALEGTALADPMASSVSLWDWAGSGLAPPYVLLLVVVPVVATLAGGRVAVAPAGGVLLRGLRLGAILGAAVVAGGWAGSLEAAAGRAGEVSIRLSFEPIPVFASALVWGVAGAWAGPRLPWFRRPLG